MPHKRKKQPAATPSQKSSRAHASTRPSEERSRKGSQPQAPSLRSKQFELPGEDAIIRKEGERLIIEPAPPKSLLAVLAKLRPLDDNFPSIAELANSSIEL